MSTGMPELGSKISLISKADIRYEGRLFTVDPQECTIALANVRSFGTEEREALYPVPAQNQIYDYILFRGSDIKDIRVVTSQPTLNDPAIVQLSVPPTLVSNYQAQGFPHPVLGHIGPGMGPYTQSYGGPIGGMSGLGGSSMAPGAGMNRDPRMAKTPSELVSSVPLDPLQADGDSHDLIGGSRPSTPGLLSRKSPTMDAGVQCSQPSNKDDKKPTPSRVIQPRAVQPPNRDGRTSQNRDHRDRREQGDFHNRREQGDFHNRREQGDFHNRREQGDFHNRREQGDFQNRRDQGDFQNSNYRDNRNQFYQQRGPQQQNQQNRTGGWITRNVRQRGRGRGLQHPGFVRQGPPQQQQNAAGAPKKQPLKFDDDYDFEQANTQFEELCSKLDKSKISTDIPATPTELKMNGDVEKKDDSGNETGAGEGEPEEEPEQVFYDKAKSFFDNISCEAVERSKGRSQRTDWRVERKLNSETFGVASARRGAFRGRGFYRGGSGGMYRGNYRGNYRGRGGQNRQHLNQPQPSTSQPAGEAAAAAK